MPSPEEVEAQQEAQLMKKYGMMKKKKAPGIQAERTYFDSADWAVRESEGACGRSAPRGSAGYGHGRVKGAEDDVLESQPSLEERLTMMRRPQETRHKHELRKASVSASSRALNPTGTQIPHTVSTVPPRWAPDAELTPHNRLVLPPAEPSMVDDTHRDH